jgi:hypothetical protein
MQLNRVGLVPLQNSVQLFNVARAFLFDRLAKFNVDLAVGDIHEAISCPKLTPEGTIEALPQ